MNAAALRKLAEMGLSISQIIEVVEADESKPERSANAERQARFRAKKAAQNVTSNVTDNVISNVTDRNEITPLACVRDNPLRLVPSGKKDTQEAKASFVARSRKSCPVEWLPNAASLAVADAEGFTSGELERELSRFRDYDFARAHADWDKTFKNWLRTARDRKPKNEQSPKFTARQANLARAFDAADSVIGFLAKDG